ncbi:MAG: DUF3618 domain-containing protein [Chloroflexota bacterium]
MTRDDRPLWSPQDTAEESASDPEVGELVEDIEVTRVELVETADELGRRLDPGNLMENAKQTARDATVGKVEAMATQAGDMVSEAGMQVRDTGTGVIETMRRNPIPTALAGIGIAWLWMSRNSTPRRPMRYAGGYDWNDRWSRDRYATGRYATARYGGDGGFGRTASDAFDAAGERASDAVDAAGRSMRRVSRSASDAADSVGRRAEDVVGDARRTLDDVGPNVQSAAEDASDTARRVLEENPLAAGAIALAVGTAVGLAMPATRVEQELMGDAGSRVIDQAQEAAARPLEKAERAMREAAPAGAATTS